MRKIKRNQVFNTLFVVFIILAGVLILSLPEKSSKAVRDSTITCLNILIPSLFPFLFISVFLTECNLTKYVFSIPSTIVSKFSGLNKKYCDIFFIGMIGGYPAAAKSISIMVKNRELDRADASVLLCFCTNAGPSFLITAVGCRMFLSSEIGLILYISSLLSSLSMLLIYSSKIKKRAKNTPKNLKPNYCDSFVKSVKASCNTMTIICAFVIIFSVFISFVEDLLDSVPFIKSIVFGALEVTQGCISASYNFSLVNILLASAICAFGGLCVIFQIKAICSEQKISVKPFIISRLINIAFNLFYTFLLLFAIPINVKQTFISNAQSAVSSVLTSPLPMLMLILCCVSLPISLSERKKSKFF